MQVAITTKSNESWIGNDIAESLHLLNCSACGDLAVYEVRVTSHNEQWQEIHCINCNHVEIKGKKRKNNKLYCDNCKHKIDCLTWCGEGANSFPGYEPESLIFEYTRGGE